MRAAGAVPVLWHLGSDLAKSCEYVTAPLLDVLTQAVSSDRVKLREFVSVRRCALGAKRFVNLRGCTHSRLLGL